MFVTEIVSLTIISRWRLDLYRQLSGVNWSYKPDQPSELRGFATCRETNAVKTFHFNTEENSTNFISDYVWGLLEEMHGKKWENVGKPTSA